MKSNINHQEIHTKKINHDITLLIISDIHLKIKHQDYNLDKIKKDLGAEFDKIDYILLPGDIIDKAETLTDKEALIKYREILKEFFNDKKVFIALGNHDYFRENDISFFYFRKMFKNMKNITLLRTGKIITENNLSFMGIIPNYTYYKENEQTTTYKKIIDDKCQNKFNPNTFNIILSHSPTAIIKLSKQNNKSIIDNTDLVVSGHMHNGITPQFLQRYLKGRGIIGPSLKLFTNYCYGTYKIKDTLFIINGAVNTYIHNKYINSLFKPQATLIKIRTIK